MRRTFKVSLCLLIFAIIGACDTKSEAGNGSSNTNSISNNNVTDQQPNNNPLQSGSWLTGGGDYRQAYFSPLKHINRSNVTELGYAWHIDLPSEHGYEATPLMVDGVLYGSGPQGIAFAVDASNGRSLWQFNPEIDPQFMRKVCCGVVNRGVALSGETVFVAALGPPFCPR